MNNQHAGEKPVWKSVAVIEKRSFELAESLETVVHSGIRYFQTAKTFLFEEIEKKFWHNSEDS